MKTRVRWWGAFAVFAVLLLVAVVVPTRAYAEGYQGRHWDGSRVVDQWGDVSNPTYLGTDVGDDLEAGWYCANESFSDVNRPTVHGTVNLILRDGVTMELSNGIHVPAGATLNIYGQSAGTGKLYTSRAEADCAAIGGDKNGDTGTINIYGGTIDVTGGSHTANGGAGIGGGDTGNGGTIKIYGGTVNATGGCDGAGIGGGDGGDGGTIEIYGGTVTAKGDNAAGIGGGQHDDDSGGNGGTITISGGTVNATGDDAAGIGGGADGGSGGNITISGGKVTATGDDAAGIGGGDGKGSSGTIKISGGEITAIAGVNAAGIGGGYDGACERVEITGGTIKEAKGGSVNNSGGAGIGGGNGHNGGTIIINNANVTAQGGVDAAGIGGGDGVGAGNGRDGGNITIGGTPSNTIKATGGNYAAGIGGGQYGNGGSITINGGTVEATGGRDGAGIGGGEYGNGGTVTITGGKVTAIGSPGNDSFEGGAGIGGGDGTEGVDYGNGGTVNISGGEVIAKGGQDAAGIGGGDQGKGGIVNISGGIVTATGHDYAAGIGGGDGDREGTISRGDGGTVTITGDAHVTAAGGNSGAGIGSGEEGNIGGTVIIGTEGSSTGPTVIATGGKFAAGIGAGDAWIQGGSYADVDPKGANVTIYSGNVTATGGRDAAGIGGGEGGSNGTTKIYGGTVEAIAGQGGSYDGGAGIGSGDDAYEEKKNHTSGGTIEIYGGNVTASGGPGGAGIGGGEYGSGGTIAIAGGVVTANGGKYGAGIGGGNARGAGSVTITGGYVRATGGSNADGDDGGAGIGGGSNTFTSVREEMHDPGPAAGAAIGQDEISISGNCTVVAQGGACAAGIGGGRAGAPKSVTIAADDSSTVDATGGIHAAGIGGGKGNDGAGLGASVNYGVSGKITIESGTVTALGGTDGGAGIGSGAACGDPSLKTVDVTINGGTVIARAGAITENSQYDSGVAIGASGKYYKNEMKSIELDDDGDFVIEDENIPSKFKGAITLNGGHITAQAATAPESLEDYLDGALNVIGASRESNAEGRVDFNGSTVWMWTDGFSDGSAEKYSQAVRAGVDGGSIYFDDSPEHQNVWYVLTPVFGQEDFDESEVHNVGRSREERIYALTKYDEGENNYGLVVVEPQHTHDFRYTLASSDPEHGLVNDTIVAECSKLSCTIRGRKAILKIVKPLHSRYDDGLTDSDATHVTIEDSHFIQGNAEIEYYKTDADGTPEGGALEEAPIDAGTYWAQISLGSGDNSATAHVAYTIEKAPSPARVNGYAGINLAEGSKEAFLDLADNIKYDQSKEDYYPGDQQPTYTIDGADNGCTMDGSVLCTSESTQEGTVTVKVHVPGDVNYKDYDATIKVKISIKPLRQVTAGDLLGEPVEATYGQEDPVIVVAETNKPTSRDIWSMEVKEGSEDIIGVDEGGIDTVGGDLDVEFPSIKIKKAGEAYVIVTVEAANGEYAPSSVEVKIKVNQAKATITATDESIDQGGTPKGEYTVEGLIGDDAFTSAPRIAYKKGDTVVNPSVVDPGTYTIKPWNADANGNYKFSYKFGTLTVRHPCPVTVRPTASVIVNRNNLLDLNYVNLAENVSKNGATGDVHYEIVGDARGCYVGEDGILYAGNDEGTVTVNVTVDADNHYSALAATPITVTVTPKIKQAISAPQVTVGYGDVESLDEHVRVTQPTEGVGDISYVVKEGSEAAISMLDASSGLLLATDVPAAGIAHVVATAAETKTCQETSVDVPIRIERARLVVKANDIKTYVGDPVPDISDPLPYVHYAVMGLKNNDAVDVLTFQPALVYQRNGANTIPSTMMSGTYDIVPLGPDVDGDYDIIYEKGTLTVKDRKRQVITASDVNVTYGDAGMSLGATTNGDGTLSYLVKGDAVSVNANGMLTTYKTGTAYVTITASGTDNYTPAVKEVRVTVNKAQLTVTAKDEQIYAGETPEGFYDVSGLKRGDQLTTLPTLTYMQNGAEVDPQAVPAGNYDIVPSGADSGGKYTVSYVNGTLTVRGEQSVAASDVVVTYGDTGKFVRGTTNGEGAISYAVTMGAECVDVDANTGALTIKQAGAAIVTVTAAETDYYARASKDVLVMVDKKRVTIQADDKSKWVGDAGNPKLTATVSGVVPGDELTYDLSCEVGAGVGSYPIRATVDPNVAPNYNYDITSIDGTLSVTETNMSVSVAVRAEGWQGTYDGRAHGITVNVTAPEGTDYSVAYGRTAATCDATTSPTQTDVGALTVYYKVTAGNDVVTGSKDVIVEKAPITPSVSIDGWEWGQTLSNPVLAEGSNPGNGAVTYEYAHRGGSDWSAVPPVAYGDYTLLATVPETANYLGGTATADFSVAVKEATLTFHLDGGTLDGSTDDVVVKASCGDTIKLPGEPTKDDHLFLCWEGPEYEAGASYVVDGDREFTAVWEQSRSIVGALAVTVNGYSGTYDSQPHDVSVTAEPADPANTKYFVGETVYYSAETVLTAENYEQGSATCPTFTDAGNHAVHYYVVADRFEPASGTAEVRIDKAESTVTTAPVPVESLAYNGGYQELVTPGVAEGGTMEYSTDGGPWSKDVPVAVKAGAYVVRYRVTGDGNHNDAEGGVVYARIGVSYRATTGAGATWTKESKEGPAVTFRRYAEGENTAFVHFRSVAVDDVQINEGTQFTKAEGNGVVVTLRPAYLNSLPAGSHKLAVTFDDGSAETTIVVVDAPKSIAFSDVPDGTWYYDVVSRAVSLGLFGGYQDGRFGPADRITRGQVAVVLWNMAGHPAPGANAIRFADVRSKVYYTDAIAWTSGAGVVSGYADGRFGPDDPVTREQLATMLASYARRVAGKTTNGSATDFRAMKDAEKVSSWAVPSVGWCFQQGIISGTQDGYVNPRGDATRAEAAKMFVMLHDLL